MLHVHRILVSALALAGITAVAAALGGCGQKGALYLPTDPGAAQRATLPQIINSTLPYTSNPIPSEVAPLPSVAASGPMPVPSAVSPVPGPTPLPTTPAR